MVSFLFPICATDLGAPIEQLSIDSDATKPHLDFKETLAEPGAPKSTAPTEQKYAQPERGLILSHRKCWETMKPIFAFPF